MSVKFPPSALIFYNELTSIVVFDLIPTDDFFPQLFSFPDSEPLNDSFADFDFGRFWIMNMGSLFIIIIVTILQFPIYYLAKWTGCSKVVKYYRVSQFWGTPLEVIVGSYVEIWFACLINLRMFTTEGDDYSYGVWINNIFLCLALLLIVAYPGWLYFFLKKYYYDLHFKKFSDKYGAAYEGI